MCILTLIIVLLIIYFMYLGLMLALGYLTRQYYLYVDNHALNNSENDADNNDEKQDDYATDSLSTHGKLR